MSNENQEQPRIIVDSDWKAQAEKEKEQLAKEVAPAAEQEMPPADFITHCASLATQAMIFVGAIAHPMTGKAEIDLEQARYVVDVLGMLKEKTAGNLKEDEQMTLDSLIGELKLIWVQATSAPKDPGK